MTSEDSKWRENHIGNMEIYNLNILEKMSCVAYADSLNNLST